MTIPWKSSTVFNRTIVYDSARTVPNLEYGIYYIDPEACDALHPKDDKKYGNALRLRVLAAQERNTVQGLLQEALNDLFQKRNLPPIA